MKIAEIRNLSVEELKERIAGEEANYTQMRLNHSITPLENPAQIKEVRRNIARMKTVLREIELNNK
ncbi:50S ribosomal protein L29 [Pseudoprevotella muciniphila]|jgi:large subunit ribosomal protein L29|uniref:Large ribosomal subunit protein uL29 n=1 Tax=Pseudoprevotella muciniphila TaxID=2133944 RepID=A0A5P8E882_9BACT|nr:50S ribosomal protein L29 [Pseudoprevotella muciniphila]QFQ13235.1 50S ribosomal protein L29 [Pseudoprevotella muciniphila]